MTLTLPESYSLFILSTCMQEEALVAFKHSEASLNLIRNFLLTFYSTGAIGLWQTSRVGFACDLTVKIFKVEKIYLHLLENFLLIYYKFF